MSLLAAEDGLETHPLFINYGQINRRREWRACQYVHRVHGLQRPLRLTMPGWGKQFVSGLTDATRDIMLDAFSPNRNLLFLVAGAAHAYQVGADAVAIGLLDDSAHLFADQTEAFLNQTEALLCRSLGRPIRIAAPLMDFRKADVIAAAEQRGLAGTYSCHAGGVEPCGVCIACREFRFERKEG